MTNGSKLIEECLTNCVCARFFFMNPACPFLCSFLLSMKLGRVQIRIIGFDSDSVDLVRVGA